MDTTIKDVAKRAGVSITTVSAVINNTRYVSPELTECVEKAIEELDYHPDQLGRGLRKGKSKVIGLLVSDITNPFFPKIARGVEDCARENKYNVILCNTDEDSIEEKHYMSVLRSQRVDGMIIAPTSDGAKNIKRLCNDSTPIILIDRYLDSFNYPAIISDNYNGAYKAVEHLIEMGHRKIGFVAGIEGVQSTDQRLQGYQDSLRANNIDIREELIVMGNSQLKESYKATKQLLKNSNDLTAIFAANNLMVIGVLQYLKDNSISYPDEISIISFDDPDWGSAVSPSVTSVSQKPYEIGYKAGCEVFKWISDPGNYNQKDKRVTIPTKIEKRESVKEISF